MTLPRLEAISARWSRVPPLAVSVAALAQYAGVGPAPRPASGAGQTSSAARTERPAGQNPQELLDLLGGGRAGFAQEKPTWLKAAQAT